MTSQVEAVASFVVFQAALFVIAFLCALGTIDIGTSTLRYLLLAAQDNQKHFALPYPSDKKIKTDFFYRAPRLANN